MHLQRRERVHDDRSQHQEAVLTIKRFVKTIVSNPSFWGSRVTFNSNSTLGTVADTCHMFFFFFFELATRRVWNISNAFETFKTRFKYNKRLLNINNAFETLATHVKYYKRVLIIRNVFERFKMRLKHLKRGLNIIIMF